MLLCVALTGCGSSPQRPTLPDYYVVRQGDTLYSISRRYQLDYQDIARWNGIGRNYAIAVGQRLRLNPPPGTPRRVASTSVAPDRPATKPRASPTDPAHRPPPWRWPLEGGRSAGAVRQPSGAVGLRIDGDAGQLVLAAADGKVVYTGTGLLGYGQLVIVNHVRGWLSAYGHNASVLVKEGDLVSAGQAIATLGFGPGQQPMLYLEIRLDGQPVDPLSQLPRR